MIVFFTVGICKIDYVYCGDQFMAHESNQVKYN